MKPENQRLEQLLVLARKDCDKNDPASPSAPPPGFVTRVAARWVDRGKNVSLGDAWERLSWFGSAVAAAACLLALAYQHQFAEPNAFDLLLAAPSEVQAF